MDEEQTLCIIDDDEGDPEIQIQFADETSIHNCLSLASISTVGPASGVPLLTRGKKKVLNLLVGWWFMFHTCNSCNTGTSALPDVYA